MKTTANLISYIFHPLFYPFYLLIITLFLPVFGMQRYNNDFKYYLLGYVFISNILLPIVSLWLMKKYKLIESLEISNAKERTLPYLMMIGIYIFTAASLSKIQGMAIIVIYAFLLSATLVAILTIINKFVKISAHSTSATAAAVWMFILYKSLEYNTVIYLIISTLLLGLVMSSRLILKSHRPFEVWLGFFTGLTGASCTLFFI